MNDTHTQNSNKTNNTDDWPLELSLAIVRLSTAFFLMIWALDKVIGTGAAQKTFSKYYMNVDESFLIILIGIAQLILILTFAGGLFKTFTYGIILVMHTGSVLASIPRYMDPLARPNILFWAAIPVLGAMILLFILRERDRFLTVSR